MRTGMWNAEELSQEMLGKHEAEEQDRMLFDKLDGVAPMVCEEDADGEDGDALPLVDDEAGLAACLGFGAAASRSLSPPAVRMMPQAPQIPVHMSMSVPAEQHRQQQELTLMQKFHSQHFLNLAFPVQLMINWLLLFLQILCPAALIKNSKKA